MFIKFCFRTMPCTIRKKMIADANGNYPRLADLSSSETMITSSIELQVGVILVGSLIT